MVQLQRKGFRQISQEERVEIYTFLREGLTMREIWRRIDRSHTSILREIARNGIDYGWWKVVYKPLEAEKRYKKRKDRANRSHMKLRRNNKLRMKILYLFEQTKWWPDEILGRLKYEWWEVISTTTLYRYIYLYSPRWKKYLLHKSYGYRKKYGSRKWWHYKDIELTEVREEKYDTRHEIWHTESDSVMCGSGIGWLTVNTDRCSRYTRIRKIENLEWKTVCREMRRMLRWENVKSITIDNWVEFSKIRRFKKVCDIYRCNTYASYEKWTVENTNGIIRRDIPKWTIISEMTDEQIQEIEDRINHKPRKILGYRTPYEVQYTTNLAYIR
jgi:transposase, IS30 family